MGAAPLRAELWACRDLGKVRKRESTGREVTHHCDIAAEQPAGLARSTGYDDLPVLLQREPKWRVDAAEVRYRRGEAAVPPAIREEPCDHEVQQRRRPAGADDPPSTIEGERMNAEPDVAHGNAAAAEGGIERAVAAQA